MLREDALAKRKAFLVRIDPEVLEAVRRWADDDLRSLNGQIEFLLRRALQESGRSKQQPANSKQRKRKQQGGG